jgi:hypothetical protein
VVLHFTIAPLHHPTRPSPRLRLFIGGRSVPVLVLYKRCTVLLAVSAVLVPHE